MAGLVVLGMLVAVGIGTLWAEFGGKQLSLRDDAARPPDWDEDTEGSAEDDELPWEQPGAVRRDCEPDRGPMLLWLGRLSLWLIATTCLLGAVALLPVFPLAIAVLVMASRDRAKMRAGTMDPAGEALTRKGARYARAALVTVVLILLAIGGLVAALIFTDF
jgi:hypothetical protein